MWRELPLEEREEYKRMILSFASLTEMFAQKAENDDEDVILSPIINSKYQETVFQKVFNAFAEDIGNTSYDASLVRQNPDGTTTKYLIGIKTFGYASGNQKIAQFKAYSGEWSDIIGEMNRNAKGLTDKEEVNRVNHDLYKELAVRIAALRNLRMDSAEAELKGFSLSLQRDNIQAVYHVLMPSKKGEPPVIYVGETSYTKIDLDRIRILGCTSPKTPANFEFTDGRHKYRYTAADSQLLMDFTNKDIALEEWKVVYAENAYEIFSEIGNRVLEEHTKPKKKKIESYSWLITNKDGEVERYSGFNGFYGVGSKVDKESRKRRVDSLRRKFSTLPAMMMITLVGELYLFLDLNENRTLTREEKVALRERILKQLDKCGNTALKHDVVKMLFRPQSEMYIPLPYSASFHKAHPDFFGKNLGVLDGKRLRNKVHFTLVFEPSGDSCEAFLTQDYGKAIESASSQAILGDWVLRDVFQLGAYEPLTAERLTEVGKNGVRIWKEEGDSRIHLCFIWIDTDSLPEDYISKDKKKAPAE